MEIRASVHKIKTILYFMTLSIFSRVWSTVQLQLSFVIYNPDNAFLPVLTFGTSGLPVVLCTQRHDAGTPNDGFLLYYIHFEITGYPCNLFGSQQCDLFLNRTSFCSKLHLFQIASFMFYIASFLFRIQNEM